MAKTVMGELRKDRTLTGIKVFGDALEETGEDAAAKTARQEARLLSVLLKGLAEKNIGARGEVQVTERTAVSYRLCPSDTRFMVTVIGPTPLNTGDVVDLKRIVCEFGRRRGIGSDKDDGDALNIKKVKEAVKNMRTRMEFYENDTGGYANPTLAVCLRMALEDLSLPF